MNLLTMQLDPDSTRRIMTGHCRVIFKDRTSPLWRQLLEGRRIDRVRVRSDEATHVEVIVACRGVIPAVRHGLPVYAICLGGRA